MLTFGPRCSIFAVEVLAELLNEGYQLQIAIAQAYTNKFSVNCSPRSNGDAGSNIRVALF